MGLFDMFRKPKTELENVNDELMERLFPGGRQEVLFKAKVVADLSNGKLNVEEAAGLCFSIKFRLFGAVTKFDGRRNLGVNAEQIVRQTVEHSKGKLASTEAAAIVYYLFFDKVDPGLESFFTIKTYCEGVFGSDSVGCDTDEIPSGLGEFGFEVTNPIPVRGAASNDVYLSGLRTKDGLSLTFKRNGSTTAPNISGKIDEYELSQGGRAVCKLFLSPYNKKISERPPRGFILVRDD